MKCLLGLWKANVWTTVLQAAFGAGFYYIAMNSPRAEMEGAAERAIFALFELLMVSLLAGIFVSAGIALNRDARDKERKAEDRRRETNLIPMYPGWISVFALFLALVAVMAGAYGAETYSATVAGWESGGMETFSATFHAFVFLFVFLCYGGMFAFCGIGSFACILKAADENNTPRWVYGAAALPFGTGVILGGILILLRRWHSPQSLQKIS